MSLLPNLESAVVTTARRYDRGQRAPRRRRIAFMAAGAGALAIAGTAAVLVIGAASGGQHGPLRPLDVVGEARAALAPRGGILHIALTTHSDVLSKTGHRIRSTGQAAIDEHVEQWSATDPVRFRMLIHESPERKPGTDRPLQARNEIAWANRTQSSYDAQRNSMNSVSKLSPRSSASRLPAIPGVDQSLDGISAMLAEGKLKDRGEVVVGGRHLRRLAGRLSNGMRPGTVDYDVDPRTFEPVRITTRMKMTPMTWTVVEVATVTQFDHLPLTPSTEQLLVIHPPAGTTIVSRTLAQARAYGRRQAAAEAKRAAAWKAKHGWGGP